MEQLGVKMTVEKLPWDYTCDGDDISPNIEIQGAGFKRLALMMLDQDSPGGGGFVHWIMWNIEAVSIIPEKIPKESVVSFPISAVQGTNNFGRIGYSGPCPPAGEQHRYDIKIYGIDADLDLPAGATLKELAKAMEGHITYPLW